MREFRKAKGVTERYTSLEALREGFGLKPIKKRTDNEDKLKAQREKFVGKCKACGKPLVWIEGTNALACQNPDCRGIKMTSVDKDGVEKIWYIPVIRTLNDGGSEIAERLFS